jgi:hypothetical protein
VSALDHLLSKNDDSIDKSVIVDYTYLMNSKFQEIITIPAMAVPGMSTEEIRIAVLEASLEYVKGSLPLQTLTAIATKIQYFMGIRGEDSTHVQNMLSKITELAKNHTAQKEAVIFIENMLFESVNKKIENNSARFLQ